MIRILIADDHAIVRKGLKQIVSETGNMIVVGEAADGGELLTRLLGTACDVVLLDISMPGRGGLEALKQLKRERPDLPVLILSVYPEEQYAVRSLKAGAAGYLNKESAPEELVAAIRAAARGKKYLSPAVVETLASHIEADSSEPPHNTLSDREYQVMAMLASGMTVGEIAEELSLSVKTISTNRTRLLKKMRMRTNAELIYYAIKEGLVN